jgi:hypothetical protein
VIAFSDSVWYPVVECTDRGEARGIVAGQHYLVYLGFLSQVDEPTGPTPE